MKRAKAKSDNPQENLRLFLKSISAEVGLRFEAKITIVENALRLSNAFVDLINEDSQHFEEYCGRHSTAQIFESIRMHVITMIAQYADDSVDFAEFVEAYESLLDQRLSGSAGCFNLVSSQNEKRKRGVFYTPDNLARDLTQRALRLLILQGEASTVEKLLALKIVDPAMGAGSFLLMALEILTECILEKLKAGNENEWSAIHNQITLSTNFHGGIAKLRTLDCDELKVLVLRTVANRCLYGLDVDDAAVELVRVGMAKRCRLAPAEAGFRNLRRGNALVGLWQNPDDNVLSSAIKRLSERAPDSRCFQRIEIDCLNDKERRDLICMQFFNASVAANETDRSVETIAHRMKFFHWNLEFPDVFSGDNPGFDLVLTNPPWEIEKANSREFFSRYDASYMSLSKQAALLRQKELSASDKTIEEEWTHYVAYHDGFSAFLQKVSEALAPFRHQGGGDLNSYKLFLELGYLLLKTNGVMAQIVPSGIYSDKGSTELRRLFIDNCRWLFLHGYHNREGIFDIHRSFKFCTLGVAKGGKTNQVDCRFLRVSTDEIDEGSVSYKTDTLKKLSPEHLAFTEISQALELRLIEKLADVCVPLGASQQAKSATVNESDVSISFRREFDMTNDSKLFIERSTAQKDGFALDIFGHWLKGAWRPIEKFDSRHTGEFAIAADGKTALAIDDIRRVLLPIYEGRMIGQYDWAKKAWMQGKGRRADWAELPYDEKRILPQYLLDLDDYLKMQPQRGAKIAYLAVGASTNTRSCIASMIGDWPCGNAVPVLSTGVDNFGSVNYEHLAAVLACLNSFVFDFLLRMRLSANNLNWFILKECFVPNLTKLARNRELFSAVCELSMHEALLAEGLHARRARLARRLKLRAFVEAVIADSYSVEDRDCQLILRGCDIGGIKASKGISPSIDKGFHRIDLHLPADLRAPYLFFQGFQLLQQHGSSWFFENLDDDNVLFSQQYFDQQNAGTKSAASSVPSVMSGLVQSEMWRLDSGSNNGSNHHGHLEYQQLMHRIRNAGDGGASPRKVPSEGALRLSEA